MTKLHRRQRQRAGWANGHLMQIASGQDWFGGGFGHLWEKSDDDLRDVIDAMSECWAECGAEMENYCRARQWELPPWFAQYADAPQKLFDEITSDPMRDWHMKVRANRFKHKPAADAPSAAGK
jgi:hypothetical protein